MSEKPRQPSLHVVGYPDATSTPSTLGEAGRRLWTEVQREFDVSDVCGRELLGQACEAADRA